MSHMQSMVDEFFRAPRMPADTHEEWLLRLCSQLMHREAELVARLESHTRQNRTETSSMQTNSCQQTTSQQTSSCDDSDASTKPSTDMATTSWGES